MMSLDICLEVTSYLLKSLYYTLTVLDGPYFVRLQAGPVYQAGVFFGVARSPL